MKGLPTSVATRKAATHEFSVRRAGNATTTFTHVDALLRRADLRSGMRGIWSVGGVSWDSGAAHGWLITAPSLYKRGTGCWCR